MSISCPSICYTVNLYGFGPGGVSCQCDNTTLGPYRTGPNQCQCTTCFNQESATVVRAFGYTDNVCKYGIDCGHCEMDALENPTTSPPVAATPIPATAPVLTPAITPVTNAPMITSSTPALYVVTSAPVMNHSNNKVESPPSLALWQVVLITCCSVVVLAVGISTAMSCYCKARRLAEKRDDEITEQYHGYWHQLNAMEGSGSGHRNHSFATTPGSSFASNHRPSHYPIQHDRISATSIIVPIQLKGGHERNEIGTQSITQPSSYSREIAIEL